MENRRSSRIPKPLRMRRRRSPSCSNSTERNRCLRRRGVDGRAEASGRHPHARQPGALGCTAPFVVNCFRTSSESWTLRAAKLPAERFQQEKAALEARIARDSRDADAHLKLGELHLRQGQYAEPSDRSGTASR